MLQLRKASKRVKQVGGGKCSICGYPGTNKTTCPWNENVPPENRNYAKHGPGPLMRQDHESVSAESTAAQRAESPKKNDTPRLLMVDYFFSHHRSAAHDVSITQRLAMRTDIKSIYSTRLKDGSYLVILRSTEDLSRQPLVVDYYVVEAKVAVDHKITLKFLKKVPIHEWVATIKVKATYKGQPYTMPDDNNRGSAVDALSRTDYFHDVLSPYASCMSYRTVDAATVAMTIHAHASINDEAPIVIGSTEQFTIEYDADYDLEPELHQTPFDNKIRQSVGPNGELYEPEIEVLCTVVSAKYIGLAKASDTLPASAVELVSKTGPALVLSETTLAALKGAIMNVQHHHVNKELQMTDEAVTLVADVLHRLAGRSIDLLRAAKTKVQHFQPVIDGALTGELAKHARREVESSILNSSRLVFPEFPEYRAAMAPLTFSARLNGFCTSLRAMLEYMAVEILEIGSNVANAARHDRLTAEDLKVAIVSDEELKATLAEFL